MPCRLAEDPHQWMDGGTWKGVMHEMIWDEDGEILALRPRPAAWHPPPSRPDYRCCLVPRAWLGVPCWVLCPLLTAQLRYRLQLGAGQHKPGPAGETAASLGNTAC